MNYSTEKNNRVYICGEIMSGAKFSHEVFGEGFYEFYVKVFRLSGQADILPVTICRPGLQFLLCSFSFNPFLLQYPSQVSVR